MDIDLKNHIGNHSNPHGGNMKVSQRLAVGVDEYDLIYGNACNVQNGATIDTLIITNYCNALGDVYIDGDLVVEGVAGFSNAAILTLLAIDIHALGWIQVDKGITSLSTWLNEFNNLTVSGTGTALTVSNNVSIGGVLTVGTISALTVNNTSTLKDTVYCTKATGTGLAVTANATVGGTATIGDTVNCTKATGTGLAVTKDATFGGVITVSGSGSSEFNDTLRCTKASSIGLSVTAQANVGSIVSTTTTYSGDTVTCGKATGTGLAVTANATVGGTATISNTTYCTKSTGTGLAVTANATVGGTATISNTTYCTKSTGTGLAVTANATIGGTCTAGYFYGDGSNLTNLPAASVQMLSMSDQKTSGTSGGGASAGSWFTRAINTNHYNNITGASRTGNQITLPAGTYWIIASAPAYKVDSFSTRFRDVTASNTVVIGSSEWSSSAGNYAQTRSLLNGIFTFAGTHDFEIQMQVETTNASNGCGRPASFGTENYTMLMIQKLS